MSISSAVVGLLLTLVCLPQQAAAGLFLAKLSEAELRRVLLAEIESAIGSDLKDVPEKRIAELESALRPTFDVLPKNRYGKLDHEGVRYLLRRTFVQQHGWFINGLQSEGQVWNSSDGKGLRDHLPELLQELFEKRVGENGCELREVVALAATIEHLIRDELRGKLELVYEAKQVGLQDAVSTSQAVNLMEVYMIFHIRGHDASGFSADALKMLEKHFHKQYKAWNELKQVMHEAVGEISPSNQGSHTFDDVVSMLEVVANRFSSFYETQCTDMKSALLDLEDRRSGRVRLVDFYKAALDDGMHQFGESIEVMRDYGVLDEVDPSTPRVIIANYIGGHSNCVARTGFYSTCCPDQCENLLNNIERSLGKSEATPAELDSPKLSVWLRNRLQDLAQHGGGKITLHGRLFAQWMHFAHPQDCMYPHVSGAITRAPYDEWRRESGRATSLTVEEIQQKALDLHDQASSSSEQHEHVGMWTMEEELFVGGKKGGESDSSSGTVFAKLLLYPAGAFSLVFGIYTLASRSSQDSKSWSFAEKAAMDKYV